MEHWLEGLSRREQITRLRGLARAALAEYDLPTPHLNLLAHLFNTTFRVDTAGGCRYVLHIHRSGTPTVETVNAELAWLQALRRDTSLEVPEPVPARGGALLTVVSTPDMPEPHICVMLRWLDGRRLDTGLAPIHLERLGILMAQLHEHASRFGPPRGFARGRVDRLILSAPVGWGADPFAPEIVSAALDLVARTLSAEEAAQVGVVIERAQAVEQALSREPGTFGLIHADLHRYNLLFGSGTVRAIDFDDCGFGPLLYDPAVTLDNLPDRAAHPAMRAALLKGYRQVRPLSAEHEALIDTFIALRKVQDALWVLEYREHPAIKGDWRALARRVLAPLTAFLEAGGRFP